MLAWLKSVGMFCSHVIGTFQKRAVNDELNRS